MRLTRAQLRNELLVRDLQHTNDQAQLGAERDAHALTRAQVADLQQQVDALRAEPRAAAPALADNIRLAHRLEVAEARIAELEAIHRLDQARAEALMDRHPHLFPPADRRTA